MGLQLTQYRTVSGTGLVAQSIEKCDVSKMTDWAFVLPTVCLLSFLSYICACDSHVTIM